MARAASWTYTFCLAWLVSVSPAPATEPTSAAEPATTVAPLPIAAPLWAAIDHEIARRATGPLSGPAADSQFLRRVYLDLAGEIPPSWLAREFPQDTDPAKRERLVERLLSGPAFARRMREAWTVMLLERHEGKAVPDAAWEAYLESAFWSGKPWNEIARELVAADGFDDATRPAIRFLAEGSRSDPHARTQDFARLFLGMNLQCAQCHDHPTITDYKQSQYFGLFSFLSPTKLVRDKQEQPRLVEAVVQAKSDFVSVFHPDDKRSIGPRLLDEPEVAIPPTSKGEEFASPPANGLPGLPRFQPRKLLANQLSGSEAAQRRFARNAVNRVWFLFFGRGLVHPLDLDHSANPPSHPELLDRLTSDFIANGFDMRWLTRSICLSATYQRSNESPVATNTVNSATATATTATATTAATAATASFATSTVRPLSPEQLARSLARATRQSFANESPKTEKPFTLKDYLNRRLDPPKGWRDVMVVFAGVFGHPAGQAEVDFRPSVEQALFLSNDPLIHGWLAPSTDGLIRDLLSDGLDEEACVEEVYLSFLSRLPEASERALAEEWLRRSENRSEALRDLCLALICSAEFRFVG